MFPLIDCDQLADRLDQVRLCDIRWSLTEPGKGRSSYLAGHIPGAVFVDLDTDLSAPPGPGRHPLPEVDDFASTLRRLGIGPEDEVVVYDDASGQVAARMWWMLRSIGHERSRVLDGGLVAWVEAGYPTETGERRPKPRPYPTPEGFTGVARLDQIEGRALVDARAPDRYRGEVEPIDPKAGHIPGALNLPSAGNLREDGSFLDPADLAERYAGVSGRPVVSCGSGVNACHAALAMVLAGREMPDVYIGSFSEWSRLDLPVSTGPDP